VMLAGGCASPSQKSAEQTRASLADTREEIVKARNELSETMASLQAIQKPDANLQVSFEQLKKQIKDLQDQRMRIYDRAQDMRAHQDEYSKQWQAEIMQMSDPQAQATAKDRAARLRDRFGTIATLGNDAREDYDPLIKDIKDLESYLGSNLSRSGVQMAKPSFDKVQQDGSALAQKLDALIQEMNIVTAKMSPDGKVAS
jgi:chromosome segregation ATPase